MTKIDQIVEWSHM